jgi:lysozyme
MIVSVDYLNSQQLETIKTLVEPAFYLKAQFEGFRERPYLCPAGVPTIGFGNTYYTNGQRVTLSDPPISLEEGYQLMLNVTLKDFLPRLTRLCPDLLPYSIRTGDCYKISAILSLVYNIGIANLAGSTLRKCINDVTRWEEVPFQLSRWNKSKGKILRGLTLRRLAEAEYWNRFDLWNKYRQRSYAE